ncbi:MAG: hypothetical protein JXN64_06200 [Spirochaetes bacterium]|nr:hypothetical protein [Spirochaetota bacterium]
MKKLLSAILLFGLLALPVLPEEKKPEVKMKYKIPKIEQVAIYPDIGAMAVCIDGDLYLLIYHVGYIKFGKCQSEEQ